MYKKFFAVLMVAAVVGGFSMLKSAGEAASGKTIFEDSKCTTCHSIESQGVESKAKPGKYPDLSDVGSKVNADFIVKFLKKDVDLDGKKHPIAFKGEDAQLQTVADWLASLKKVEENK